MNNNIVFLEHLETIIDMYYLPSETRIKYLMEIFELEEPEDIANWVNSRIDTARKFI